MVVSQTEWVKSLSLEGKRKLIIELDGGQHALPDEILKNRQRDVWLEKEGYTVVLETLKEADARMYQ